jgi:hypothetical protein
MKVVVQSVDLETRLDLRHPVVPEILEIHLVALGIRPVVLEILEMSDIEGKNSFYQLLFSFILIKV